MPTTTSREGGHGRGRPSSGRQLLSAWQSRRMADDGLDPGRGLGPLRHRLRPHLHPQSVSSRPAAARPRGRRDAGRSADRRPHRRLADRQDRPALHVPRNHGDVHRACDRAGVRRQRRGARRHPLLPRHSARQRHLDRLHLHHGRDGQGPPRRDGQPLAVHVRRRRGFDAGGHRRLSRRRHESRVGLARDARRSAPCRRW